MREGSKPFSVSDGPALLSCDAQEFCGRPHYACGRGSHAFVCAFVGMVGTQFHGTGDGNAPLLGKTWRSGRRKEEAWSEVALGVGREGEWRKARQASSAAERSFVGGLHQ